MLYFQEAVFPEVLILACNKYYNDVKVLKYCSFQYLPEKLMYSLESLFTSFGFSQLK